ncbi:MAG: hypothetical protein PHE27_04130 [Alphaproteobacteria bacterium]|nr:hypothetical protein [Alphaproteobacteria bacterium]
MQQSPEKNKKSILQISRDFVKAAADALARKLASRKELQKGFNSVYDFAMKIDGLPPGIKKALIATKEVMDAATAEVGLNGPKPAAVTSITSKRPTVFSKPSPKGFNI